MRQTATIILVSFLSLSACRKDADRQKVHQEQINDSLHDMDMDYYRNNRTAIQLDNLRKEYTRKRADLLVAYETRTKTAKFHLLRREEDKQRLIQQQNLYIDRLEDSLNKDAKTIELLERKMKKNK